MSPEYYFPLIYILNIAVNAATVIIVGLSCLTRKNTGLMLILISSILQIPITIEMILFKIVELESNATNTKELLKLYHLKYLYNYQTAFEPIALIMGFIGIVLIARENEKKRLPDSSEKSFS